MVLSATQRFTGLLGLAPIEQRLRVWTEFDTSHMEVGTEDGEHYSWPFEAIEATPYDTRVMEMVLDGSRLYFVADDPLRFADRFTEALNTHQNDHSGPRRRRRVRVSDPLDLRTEIPVVPSTASTAGLRRSVDRDRLVPAGPKGKLRRPKQHVHDWVGTDSSYGFSRHVCHICRHVTIDLTGPAITADPRRLPAFRDVNFV